MVECDEWLWTNRGDRGERLVNRLMTAYQLLREHGFNTLLSTLIEKLQNRSNGFLLAGPIFLLHQLLFLLDEGSMAVPSGSTWSVRSLPFFRFERSLPALTIVPGSHHGSSRHVGMMGELYTYEDFVGVEPGDLVVDVGAYVGGFTRYAARSAERVICVEPGADFDDVLVTNVRDVENVTVVPQAAWSRREPLSINRSSSPNETSLLTPDTGTTESTVEVTGDTVSNIVRGEGYDRIDFLKVEAEGAEPEILRGALEDEMVIDRVAVDASPEGGSQTTMVEVRDLLEAHGYDCRVKEQEKWWEGFILFARRPE